MFDTLATRLSRFEEKLDNVKEDICEIKQQVNNIHDFVYVDGETKSITTRITIIESDIKELNTIRNYLYGAIGFILFAVVGAIGWLITSGKAVKILGDE